MSNVDNRGLEIPIDALSSIVSDYSTSSLSRADIWALATLVAAENAQGDDDTVSFPFEWYGRSDCSSSDGKTGPTQSLPSNDLTTHGLLDFFSTNFGLSTRETVALMGAHTIGQLSQENSGFNGPNGWTNNNRRLNNGYYDGIIGGNEDETTFEETDIDTWIRARNWDREEEDNSAFPDIPNRHVWVHRRGGGGRRTLMTNSDIALVRDLSAHIDESTGEVSCSFRRCPHAVETLEMAARFKYDVEQWKVEFRDVLTKMLLNNYDTSGVCSSPPCQL